MLSIEGRTIRLRAVEPSDAELMYQWDNDAELWCVSGTTEPFSRQQMERFAKQQQTADIFQTGQLRLIIETLLSGKPVGAIDLFEFEPICSRAGVGILIYELSDRSRGYASDALTALCQYAREKLRLNQLWCDVGVYNEPSLKLFHGAGFTDIGIKHDWQWEGRYTDVVMMQKIMK